jgi:transmembrane sensor
LQEKREAKIIPLYRNKTVFSIAASFLLIIGLSVSYFLFFASSEIQYQCEAGQKLDVYLPDKSHVTLNGHSSITFNEKNWLEKREIKLDGEAYFEVTKKGPFKVKFERGDVDVLGTKFNIMSGKDIATVKCYEGKVSVTTQNITQQILTRGMAIRLLGMASIDSFTVDTEEPDWKKGENSFNEAPILEVINALSIQFNTQFEISNTIDLNRKYTGKFVHTDLDTALKMVFTPMGIEYSVEGEKRKIVTLK